jgi:hypothetical protein
MRTPWIFSILMVILVLMVSACQNLPSNVAEAAPAKLNEATFIASEYAYQGPESIPGGWSHLTLDNQGKLAHDLILVKLGEGKTTNDVMDALAAEGPPEWAEFYGNITAEPGQKAAYTVKLVPGNYAILSFGQAEDGPPDAAQGMLAALKVGEPQAEVNEAELPQAKAEINLVDFSYVIKGELAAGEQTIRINNTGKEMHELVIYRLKDGATLADFQAALDKEMNGEEVSPADMPAEEAGATFISPGVSTYVNLDLEAGNYIFICHLPSPAHEMQSHFALGMLQQVKVQ